MTSNPCGDDELNVMTCGNPEHDSASPCCEDREHTWIEITNNFNAFNCDDLPTVLASYRWTANLIARLALDLALDLEHDRRTHNCERHNPNDLRPLCGVTLSGRVVWAKPDHLNSDDPPKLTITFPTHRLKHYENRVKKAINDIDKSDRWTPTHTQQAAWRYTPDPTAPNPQQNTRARHYQEQN